MMFKFLRATIFPFKSTGHPFIIVRYKRNINRRSAGPKFIEGKVKTVTEFDNDEFADVNSFQDLVKRIKTSEKFSDVAIEEAFTKEDNLGDAIARSSEQREGHRHSQSHQDFIKRQIIERKYFKYEQETNLLTHAAKLQIRYLNKLNPDEWTPESISDCFPISVNGVKKLLKSNFELRSPEKIRKHDEEVEERWKLLKSGAYSDSITFYTQRMWDEGKIIKENYKGNPNLPNVQAVCGTKIIKEEKSKVAGEYSAIIQHYINYKKEKEAPEESACTNDELQMCNDSMKFPGAKSSRSGISLNKKKYFVDDETESNFDGYSKKYPRKSEPEDEVDLLHSQFQLNLKDELSSHKHDPNSEYVKWFKQQSTRKSLQNTSAKSVRAKEMFTKIPKFAKETIELKREKTRSGENLYLYDDKLGYQYPKGNNIKAKINISSRLKKKGNAYKVEQCVYAEDGELLYKVPG